REVAPREECVEPLGARGDAAAVDLVLAQVVQDPDVGRVVGIGAREALVVGEVQRGASACDGVPVRASASVTASWQRKTVSSRRCTPAISSNSTLPSVVITSRDPARTPRLK